MTFDNLNYEEFIEDYFETFSIEFGKRKFEKIYRKVFTSNKISNLIFISNQSMVPPNKNDFLYSLNEIPFFIFSKADTLALGALLALERWNIECNKNLNLLDTDDLKNTAVKILIDCKKLKFKR